MGINEPLKWKSSLLDLYLPHSEASEGYVFTGMCHSFCSTMGGSASQMHHWWYDHTRQGSLPSWGSALLGGSDLLAGGSALLARQTPQEGRPPQKEDPNPRKADPPPGNTVNGQHQWNAYLLMYILMSNSVVCFSLWYWFNLYTFVQFLIIVCIATIDSISSAFINPVVRFCKRRMPQVIKMSLSTF